MHTGIKGKFCVSMMDHFLPQHFSSSPMLYMSQSVKVYTLESGTELQNVYFY